MTDCGGENLRVLPAQGSITLTHVLYGLHAFSALTGMMSAAFIVTAFLTGWPSIIAVIINYVKRDSVPAPFSTAISPGNCVPSGGRLAGSSSPGC